jgi:uncharacterized protein (DUF58 family)
VAISIGAVRPEPVARALARAGRLVTDARRGRLLRSATPTSAAVAAIAALAWVGAWRLGWDELAVLAGGCFAALAVAAAFTVGRADLAVSIGVDPVRVSIGDRPVGRIEVTNAADRRMLPLRLEAPVGAGLARMEVPSLDAGAGHEEVFVVPTTRRAVITIGPVHSVRGDPLGLFRREVAWPGRAELFVHPAIAVQPGVTAGWIRDLEGRETSEPSSSDVAFHALREYVSGDDRRHIHWRTSARLGRFMVRQFVDTRRAHVAVVLSTSPADYGTEDEFELAVSVIGSVGASALADRQDVTCIAGGERVPSHARSRLLDGLSGVTLGRRDVPLHRTVAEAVPRVTRASIVVLAAGGGVDLATLHAAATRFPGDLRVIAVRAAEGSDVRVHRSAAITTVDLGSLDQLAPALRAVASR